MQRVFVSTSSQHNAGGIKSSGDLNKNGKQVNK